MSWIHIDDWAKLIDWLLQRDDISGAINATAPDPVTNETFSRAIAEALRRPNWFRVPPLALRAAVGEIAGTLLTGQRVLPKRALDHGFSFDYTVVTEAIRHATR
jgi:NAD dependent epimerase/dehydratase family enzyme